MAGQFGFGVEADRIGHAGRRPPLGVLGPGLGQVEADIDRRVSGRGRQGEVDGDLAVLDPPGRPRVLALHPDRRTALLDITGLIDRQNPQIRTGIEVLGHVGADLGSDLVLIPRGTRKQVLEPVRIRFPGDLGESPAVAPLQMRHQRRGQGLRPQSGLDPPEGWSDPGQQRFQIHLPPFDR